MFAEGFRNEVKSSTPCFLMMKMPLHQWRLCLVHPWRFSISDIPFDGPIAGVGGLCRWSNHHHPTPEQAEQSLLELTVAGTKHAINMVESGA